MVVLGGGGGGVGGGVTLFKRFWILFIYFYEGKIIYSVMQKNQSE